MNKNKRLIIEFFSIVITLVGIFVIVGAFGLNSYLKAQPVEPSDTAEAEITTQAPVVASTEAVTEVTETLPHKEEEHKKINILVMGLDKGQSRSDVIFVTSFDTKTKQISILSVPRDTRVNLDNYGYVKINEVHAYEGTSGSIKLIEKLLNIKLDNYVEVNLAGFRNVVDAIGGVEMEVPQAMYYSDPVQDLYINLKAGLQTLDGKKAEQLVRFRSYPQADLKRIEVQQLFMKAFIQKVLNTENLIRTAPKLAYNALKYVRTDVGIDDVLDYVNYINDIKVENVEMFTLPGEAQTINKKSFFINNASQTKELSNQIFLIEE